MVAIQVVKDGNCVVSGVSWFQTYPHSGERIDLLLQLHARPGKPRAHSADRNTQRVRRFLIIAVHFKRHFQDFLHVRRQAVDGLDDACQLPVSVYLMSDVVIPLQIGMHFVFPAFLIRLAVHLRK